MVGETRAEEVVAAAVEPRVLELMHLLRAVVLRGRPPEGLERLFRDAAASGVLGRRHLPLLLSLALEGKATVGELAARVGLAPATTSLLANELNRAGLLERREDNRDRRRTIVSLPEQHRQLIEERARRWIEPLERALERLGPRRSEQLFAALRVLAAELEAAAEESELPR